MSIRVLNSIDKEKLCIFLRDCQYLFSDYYKSMIEQKDVVEKYIENFFYDDIKILRYFLLNDELKCVLILEKLHWDSEFFKKNMWKMKIIVNSNILEVSNPIKTEILNICIENQIEHITCQVQSRDYNAVHILEQIGLKSVDAIVRYGIDLNDYNANIKEQLFKEVEIIDYNDCHYDMLLDVTREAFMDYPNRFKNDDAFTSGQCNSFYIEWAINSTKGFSDIILVAHDKNKNRVVGFITAKHFNDKKILGDYLIVEGQLTAVSKDSRGYGLNTKMLLEMLNISAGYADFFQIRTQIYNYASQRTYYKCGLKPVDSYYTFHMSVK